jgi:hypothetical protein
MEEIRIHFIQFFNNTILSYKKGLFYFPKKSCFEDGYVSMVLLYSSYDSINFRNPYLKNYRFL